MSQSRSVISTQKKSPSVCFLCLMGKKRENKLNTCLRVNMKTVINRCAIDFNDINESSVQNDGTFCNLV